MGARLIQGVLLAAILMVAPPAFGHTTRGNREVRIDRGIGPIDVGDTHSDPAAA